MIGSVHTARVYGPCSRAVFTGRVDRRLWARSRLISYFSAKGVRPYCTFGVHVVRTRPMNNGSVYRPVSHLRRC